MTTAIVSTHGLVGKRARHAIQTAPPKTPAAVPAEVANALPRHTKQSSGQASQDGLELVHPPDPVARGQSRGASGGHWCCSARLHWASSPLRARPPEATDPQRLSWKVPLTVCGARCDRVRRGVDAGTRRDPRHRPGRYTYRPCTYSDEKTSAYHTPQQDRPAGRQANAHSDTVLGNQRQCLMRWLTGWLACQEAGFKCDIAAIWCPLTLWGRDRPDVRRRRNRERADGPGRCGLHMYTPRGPRGGRQPVSTQAFFTTAVSGKSGSDQSRSSNHAPERITDSVCRLGDLCRQRGTYRGVAGPAAACEGHLCSIAVDCTPLSSTRPASSSLRRARAMDMCDRQARRCSR